VPDLLGDRESSYARRLAIVRDADLCGGTSATLHRLMFRIVGALESDGASPRRH
jgi:hypothetical protein